MIVCPRCGADTRVAETRNDPAHVSSQRRRRVCSDVSCNHRVSTIEVIVDDTRVMRDEPLLISRSELERVVHSLAAPLVAYLGPTIVEKIIHGETTSREIEDEPIGNTDLHGSAQMASAVDARRPRSPRR